MKTKKGKISSHKRKAMKKRNAKVRDQFFAYCKWSREQNDFFKMAGGF